MAFCQPAFVVKFCVGAVEAGAALTPAAATLGLEAAWAVVAGSSARPASAPTATAMRARFLRLNTWVPFRAFTCRAAAPGRVRAPYGEGAIRKNPGAQGGSRGRPRHLSDAEAWQLGPRA